MSPIHGAVSAPEDGEPLVCSSGDPDRPFAVRLDPGDEPTPLSRPDAWRLLFELEAELVRTLQAPPLLQERTS